MSEKNKIEYDTQVYLDMKNDMYQDGNSLYELDLTYPFSIGFDHGVELAQEKAYIAGWEACANMVKQELERHKS